MNEAAREIIRPQPQAGRELQRGLIRTPHRTEMTDLWYCCLMLLNDDGSRNAGVCVARQRLRQRSCPGAQPVGRLASFQSDGAKTGTALLACPKLVWTAKVAPAQGQGCEATVLESTLLRTSDMI
jgi:hypothetical protein